VLPDDFMHPMSIDDIQIITDPSIPEYPPCVLEEEHPIPPPATKKKTTTFVSTLPRRKTRSTRSVEAAIGRQDMEQAIPILHPLFPMVDAETVPQESTVHVETNPQELVLTDTVVTQEPTAPQKIVPLEPVILEPTVHVETAPQEPVRQPQLLHKNQLHNMLRMYHFPIICPNRAKDQEYRKFQDRCTNNRK
jgi:hypothetical protein